MKTKKTTRRISSTISEEYWLLKERYGIKISEALRIGLGVLFAERGEKQFQSPVTAARAELLYKVIKGNENE
jgi:hypothetical protein